jgi:ABC-type multidrug transport system ATPase subunit
LSRGQVRLAPSRGKTRALSSLSLEVAAGEVFGYLGPKGAGKPVLRL